MHGPCSKCGKPITYKVKPATGCYEKRCASCRYKMQKEAKFLRMGMAPGQHDAEVEQAQGRCSACGDIGMRAGKPHLNRDHSHTTGRARDLLCDSCNIILGHSKDDPARLRKLAKYLEKHARV